MGHVGAFPSVIVLAKQPARFPSWVLRASSCRIILLEDTALRTAMVGEEEPPFAAGIYNHATFRQRRR
jgi:hypothetical protein